MPTMEHSDEGRPLCEGADAIDIMNATLSTVLAKAQESVDAAAFAVAIKRQELEASEADAEEEEEKLDQLREEAQALVDDEHWQEMYRRLMAWSREKGHCNPRRNWQSKIDAEEKALGNWSGKQRSLARQGKLSEFRKKALERIGFTWDTVQQGWDQFEVKLREWVSEHGKIKNTNRLKSTGIFTTARHYQRVPRVMLGVISDGKVKGEKKPSHNTRFTQERVDFLTECGINWELSVEHVLALKEKHGLAFPMPGTEEHVAEADTLRELVRHHWRKHFEALVAFKKAKGHTHVTASNATPDLCEWAAKQRRLLAGFLDKEYDNKDNIRQTTGPVQKKELFDYQAELLLGIDFKYKMKDILWEAKMEESQRGDAPTKDSQLQATAAPKADAQREKTLGEKVRSDSAKKQPKTGGEDSGEEDHSTKDSVAPSWPCSICEKEFVTYEELAEHKCGVVEEATKISVPAGRLDRPPWAAVSLPEASRGEAKVLAEVYQNDVYKMALEYRKKALADEPFHLPVFRWPSKAEEIESFRLFQRCCGPLAATASGREKLIKSGELYYGDGRSIRLCRVAGCKLIHSDIPQAKWLCEWHYTVVQRPLKEWKDKEGQNRTKRPCQTSYARARKETKRYEDCRYNLTRFPRTYVNVPPGELGLSLVDGPAGLGAIVKSVSGVSADLLCPGDCIVSVDFVDTCRKTAAEALSLIEHKNHIVRRFAVMRFSSDHSYWSDVLSLAPQSQADALREIALPVAPPPPPKPESNPAPRIESKTIHCPPGPLGIQLENGKTGHVVVTVVTKVSPLINQISVGDCLVRVNSVDLRNMGVKVVVEVFKGLSRQVRLLEILRMPWKGSAQSKGEDGSALDTTSGADAEPPAPNAPFELPIKADTASATAGESEKTTGQEEEASPPSAMAVETPLTPADVDTEECVDC